MKTSLLLTPVAAIVMVAAVAACNQPQSQSLQAETPSYNVQLDLDQASLGRRSASIRITGAGRDPAAIEQVVVSTTMSEMGMRGSTVVAQEIETGRYEASDDLFTMLGEWTLTVGIEGRGFDEEATFTVEAVP